MFLKLDETQDCGKLGSWILPSIEELLENDEQILSCGITEVNE